MSFTKSVVYPLRSVLCPLQDHWYVLYKVIVMSFSKVIVMLLRKSLLCPLQGYCYVLYKVSTISFKRSVVHTLHGQCHIVYKVSARTFSMSVKHPTLTHSITKSVLLSE